MTWARWRRRLEDLLRHFFSVSGQERAIYFRMLATMFRAGIPIDRALDLLADQSSGELSRTSRAMSRLILSGHYLSNSMVQFPWVFTPLQRRLVQVGERAGALGDVLLKISVYEEYLVELRLRIRSSMTMPAIICLVCVSMVVVLPPLLFQNLFKMLDSYGVPVPNVTKIVIFAWDMFRSAWFWMLVVGGVGGLIYLLYRVNYDPKLRLKLSTFLMDLPVLGKTLRMMAVTRFARALETMVAVGLPILGALELASRATDNALFEDQMDQAVSLVKEGEQLHLALQETGLFPASFISGIEVGTQVGHLEHMLLSLANLYDQEMDYMFELLAAAVEPLVLGFVGLVVGFVVIATLLPMVKLIESL